MKKLALALTASIAQLLLAAAVGSFLLIDGTAVESYVQSRLGDELDVRIATAVFDPLTFSLRMEDVAVHITPASDAAMVFQAARLSIRRIRPSVLLRGDFSAASVAAADFMLDLAVLPDLEELDDGRAARPAIAISAVELTDGTIAWELPGDTSGKARIQTLTGALSRSRGGESGTDLVLGDLEVTAPQVTMSLRDGLYELTAESVVVSESRELLEIGKLDLQPSMADAEFFESRASRADLYRIVLTGWKIQGLSFEELRRGPALVSSTISIESLDLHITNDRRLQRDPQAPSPLMPNRAAHELPFRCAVDSLEVRRGDVRYSEYAPDGVRPGTIEFLDTNLRASHLHTESTEPVNLTATTLLQGSGELEIELRMPLDADSFLLDGRGTLGPFDLTQLNGILVDVEGVRIRRGQLTRLEFDFRMVGDEATGSMLIDYEGLRIERVDKQDHGKGVARWIEGVFMDRIVLRSASPRDRDGGLRKGEMEHERGEDEAFVPYLWRTLRSGIFSLVMRFE